MRAQQHALEIRKIATWEGPTVSPPDGPDTVDVVVATFPKPAAAQSTYDQLTRRLPASAKMRLFGQSVLVTIPAGDDGRRKQCYADLRGRTEEVFVHCKEMEASLSLSCTAASAAAATAIEQSLSGYLAPPAQMFLVPPWARDDGRGADERAQHERARGTYLALQSAGGPPRMPRNLLS
jgi:hypothetical protein